MKVAARIVVSVALFITAVVPVEAQSSCSLSPVFALFRQVAGSDVIGDCKEPAAVGESGDITQVTTRGLAVYRFADQVVAFTDGQTAWVFGPEGLQKRPAADRFGWELPVTLTPSRVALAEPAAVVTTTPTPAPTSAPVRASTSTPTVTGSKLTPALAAKCSNLGFDVAAEAALSIGGRAAELAKVLTTICRDVVEEHGEAGYECADPAIREGWRTGSRLSPGSGRTAAEGMMARIDLCTRALPR